MIENQTSIARYTGNGTITEFSIPFSFYKNADGAPETYQVAVYQRDKGQAERKLDQGTDYSVTWEEATLSGKIVLATALPNESILAIIREVPPSQEVEYKANEPFPYDGTNTALDKLTMLVQEHEEALSRKLGVTPTYDKTAEETMADVINAKESAEASAAAAKASADEVKGYAQEAENAKVGAVEAKDLAVEAAGSAELYAQNAEDSKQGADAALSQLNDQVALAQAAATEANAAKQSAQTSADQASSSAQEAKTSEDTAAQQATEATNAQKEATRASISCAVNEQRTLSYYNEVKRLADVFNAKPATDITYGFTRYATEAEAEAGELNNVSSTPAQVKKAADKAAADSKTYADTKLTEGKAYTDSEVSKAKQYADNVVASHAGNTDNPHKVTKVQVGLGNVDNTADVNKPVSGPQQEALDKKADLVNGQIPSSQLPSNAYTKDNLIAGEGIKFVSSSGENNSTAINADVTEQDLSKKADIGLENTGRITNCITKIPQDIKFELSSAGVLTLKAGSKAWYPNGKDSDGALLFGSTVTANDISWTIPDNANYENLFVFLSGNRTAASFRPADSTHSGSSDPGTTSTTYYNTSENYIDAHNSAGLDRGLTFPLAIVKVEAGKVTQIKQVFNGFGFISNTMFVLPGVSGLIPNGRNADGTLNNTAVTVSSLRTLSFSNQTQSVFGLTATSIFSSANAVYNAVDNKNYNPITGNRLGFCNCGTVETDSTGVITSLATKTAFHALDYNYLSGIDYVVESYTDAETGQWYRVYKSGWIEQGGGPVSYGGGWGQSGTVNLLKEMADQKYMVILTIATTTSYGPSLSCTGRNVTSFSWQKDACNSSSFGGNFIWMVIGQGA